LIAAVLLVAPVCAQQPRPAVKPLPADAGAFVRELVGNELNAEKNDHTRWSYRLYREEERGNQERQVIETTRGNIARTMLQNGKPLNAADRARDDQRLKVLAEDPAEQAHREKRERDDTQQAQDLFRSFPDAFVYQYDGEEDGLVRLAFTPNPKYSPPSRKLAVFHSLSGKLWADRSAMRLARIEGRLFEDVNFFLGLGHLEKGGTFKVVQAYGAGNTWQLDSSLYPSGNFQVAVWARQAGSTNKHDAVFTTSSGEEEAHYQFHPLFREFLLARCEQGLTPDRLEELKAVTSATSLPVAVAGGLNSETVAQAVAAGASILIVGGAIIKAEKVADATRTIKKAMRGRKAIPSGSFKKYTEADVRDAFRKVSTPNLADAMQKRGVMTGLLPRIKHGAKLVGRAVTVKTVDGDWAKPVEAIDRAKPGDVIVIDVGGGPTAVWGELASNSCLVKGVSGVVIDGAVRDLDTILELDFPCFSRHVAPHAGEPKGLGEIGSEIDCGGQKVHAGDWIVGDESGLIVVPQEQAVEMANRAIDVLERENRIREEIKRGGTLSSVLELEKWEQIR